MAFAVKAKSLVVPILEVCQSEEACEQQMLFRAPDEGHGDVAQIAVIGKIASKVEMRVRPLNFIFRDGSIEE